MGRVRPCGNCRSDASSRCGFCGTIKYCSRHCQSAHWNSHRCDCTRVFTARGLVGGEKYELRIAPGETVSEVRARIGALRGETHVKQMIEDLVVGGNKAKHDATKMRALFKVTDAAEFQFTIGAPRSPM